MAAADRFETRVQSLDSAIPSDSLLSEAVRLLRAGQLVAFPTETVYGLGANALDSVAVRRIFAAKGRPPTNPLIVHVADWKMLTRVVADWPTAAARLAQAFWPGPLTLVLPKSDAVSTEVTADGPTVAVRWPAHAIAASLIRLAGVPLAAPSANRSTELSPTRAEHVLASLGGRIELILDGGPTSAGIESTVVDLAGEVPILLRPGPISIAELERVIGTVRARSTNVIGPARSPGQMDRHYAPRTPVELVSRAECDERVRELRRAGEDVGLLAIGESGTPGAIVLPADAAEYASRLYAALHELDSQRLSRIVIERPPDSAEWLAVVDRLTRAVGNR